MSGRHAYARFGRFNLVGALGAGLQILLFYLLMKCFRVPEEVATPIAVEIVVLHNFFWHERFTWRDRRLEGLRRRSTRLWRFHVSNGLISLVGNTLLTYCLVERFKTPALPAAFAAIAICAPVNFFDGGPVGIQGEKNGRRKRKRLPHLTACVYVGCRTVSRFLCPLWGRQSFL